MENRTCRWPWPARCLDGSGEDESESLPESLPEPGDLLDPGPLIVHERLSECPCLILVLNFKTWLGTT